MSNVKYDIWMGSNGAVTPFRYDVNYRNYYFVTEGKIQIKLAPPKNTRYLYQNKDYENFEFRSPINPWNVQQEFKPDFDKVKCLEITITKGSIIFIPAYWWYSVKFENESTVCVFKYNTYMNNLAILPEIVKQILQQQNVKRKTVPTVNVNDNSDDVINKDVFTNE